jgi:dihydrodiol dehydrogenase / D-xylose 1-dehydrogenase (NADP)
VDVRVDKARHEEQAAMVVGWSGGRLASLSCAVRTPTDHTARIAGTDGSITMPGFWYGTRAELRAGQRHDVVDLPFRGNGFEYQIEEVARCLAAGLVESPIMPWADSLAVQRTMDDLRRQWGLVYPCEG